MNTQPLSTFLTVADANAAIAFYTNVLGAKEKYRMTEPSGRVGHAELDFDGMTLMIADEYPELNLRAPQPGSGFSTSLHLQVDNADAVIERAVQQGATLERPPVDQFFGERTGTIIDPFGHRWLIGHHIEDVSREEVQRRYEKLINE